ncbi:hypothetical protein B0H21DRAFT_372702 [Amylocystis lapponica]|nr:hypothetical protein B0H21DRAFT_372702 [Amylocystis lapponica]
MMADPDTSTIAVPRTDHTSLPPELWLEIFRCATWVSRTRGISPGDPFQRQRPANFAWGVNTPVSVLRTKCGLVLVCRAWRALATELLYEHVILSSRRNACLFLQTLISSECAARANTGTDAPYGVMPRGHGQWIRHMEVHTCSRTSKTSAFWAAIAQSLWMAPNLQVFSGFWERPLSPPVLAWFSSYIGTTVKALYWEETDVPEGEVSLLSASFLQKFQSLRVLDIRKLVFESFPFIDAAAAFALPAVTDMLLPTTPALLRFASKLALPALRSLTLDAASVRTHETSAVLSALNKLLAAHGPTLTTVELQPITSNSFKPSPIHIATFLQPGVCPALHTLVFDCCERLLDAPFAASPDPSPIPPPDPKARRGSASAPCLDAPHGALRRVGVRGMGISRLYPNRPSHAQAHLRALLGALDVLPGLEVVRTLGCMVEASTDALAPDIFIWWTEKFEAVGVDLQDGEGVVWLYTDPDPSKEFEAVEFVPIIDPVKYLHKSDAEAYNRAKAAV